MSSQGQTQYWDPRSSQTAYQQTGSQPPPPPGYDEASQLPPPPSGYENVQNRPQQSVMQIKCAQSKAMMGRWMSMLPCMHMCWAWTCAIINWTVPGIGTMMAAFIVLCPCCSKHPTWTDRLRICCINFWFGLLQLISGVLIFGFIWAAYWGWFFVVVSYIGYHNAGGAEMGEIREVMTNQPGGSKVTPGDSKAVVY